MTEGEKRAREEFMKYMNERNLEFDAGYEAGVNDVLSEVLPFIELAAMPVRPDGTYNHGRESLERKALELIKKLT